MISITEEYDRWLALGAIHTPEAIRWGRQQLGKVAKQTGNDGSGRFRASLVGHECDRLQVFSFLGAEQDGHLSNSFALNGSMSHIRWQMAGLSAGFLKQAEVKVRYGNWFKGHTDGITIDGRLFEFKTAASMHLKHIRENGVKQEYLDQMFMYMNATGVHHGVLVFEGRDWLDTLEVDVPMDWDRYHQIILRLKRLRAEIAMRHLPPMHEKCTDKSSMRAQCNFSRVCIERWAADELAREQYEDDLSRS